MPSCAFSFIFFLIFIFQDFPSPSMYSYVSEPTSQKIQLTVPLSSFSLSPPLHLSLSPFLSLPLSPSPTPSQKIHLPSPTPLCCPGPMSLPGGGCILRRAVREGGSGGARYGHMFSFVLQFHLRVARLIFFSPIYLILGSYAASVGFRPRRETERAHLFSPSSLT